MLYWIAQNYQWIFSGIGVLIISLVIHLSRKSERRRQSNTIVDNSLLTHSIVSSGSHNAQTVSATTIHAQTVNLHPAIGAPSHDDPAKTQKPQSRIKYGFIVGIGLLVPVVVLPVLYFFGPARPGVLKPEPLVDPQGHLLESPANPADLLVIGLQDKIMELRQYKESAQYPDSRMKLKDAPYFAERILGFSDSSLSPRRRYIKYEYAAFAYVAAAAAAIFDYRPKVEHYSTKAIKNARTALSMLEAAERTYQSDKDSRFLLDWVVRDNGKARVLYLRAEAECMLATVKNDANLKSQVLETWNQIDASYREKLPAAGTPQLNGCVPK